VVLAGLERRLAKRTEEPRWLTYSLAVISLALGGLFFGGELAREHDPVVIGIVAGVLCAAVGVLATKPLLGRVRTRLDAEAAGGLPLIAEGAGTGAAAFAVTAPPVGVILLAARLWLLIAGRGREQQKYAG